MPEFANQYGINLAAIHGAAIEAKKNNMLIASAEKSAQRQNMLEPIRQKAATGDQTAYALWAANDPESASKFASATKIMGEAQKAQAEQNIEHMGVIAYQLMNTPPEQQEAAWQSVRANIDPKMSAKMPEHYDSHFVQSQFLAAAGMKQIISKPDVVTTGAVDQRYRLGMPDGKPTPSMNMLKLTEGSNQKALDRQNAKGIAEITHPPGSSEGQGEAKSADEALIYRQVSGYFGGAFNPNTGEFSFSDKQGAAKSLEAAARASQLFKTGRYTRSEAALMAANGDAGAPRPATAKKGKTVIQTGTEKSTGRKIVKYSDGSVGYAN